MGGQSFIDSPSSLTAMAMQDVVLAKQHGADAVVLSNHGGRQLD